MGKPYPVMIPSKRFREILDLAQEALEARENENRMSEDHEALTTVIQVWDEICEEAERGQSR